MLATLQPKGELGLHWDPAAEHVVHLSAALSAEEGMVSAFRHSSTFSPLDHSPPHKPCAYIMLEVECGELTFL